MTGPEGHHDINKDNSKAALEALGNAARAYASLAPNLAAAGLFPPGLGVDASALMLNPAAAVAAVAAAAAKHLAAHGLNNATTNTAPPAITAPPQATMGIPFSHHGHAGQTTSPAAALMAASALLPTAAGALQGNAALNQVTALLQSVSQQVNQAQQAHSLAVASAAKPQPSATSYSPQPPQQQQSFAQQMATSEPARATPSQNTYSAAAQVVAAHAAAAAATKPTPSSALLPNIQHWSLEQLENHVNMLQQMKQPVPQSVALLLADARRKEEKKTAKRVANRKSACTSRARKKALVEEMTRTNARLRRQALILSLLPDLVIVISQEGEITFCSAQVERVLRHKIDDLIGSDIRDVLIPASRTALGKLIAELMNPSEKPSGAREGRSRRAARGGGNQQDSGGRRRENKPRDEENGNVSGASSGSGGVSSGAAAVVSDQSFPLSVVKVDSKLDPPSDENDNSDASGGGGKEPVISSLSNSTARSPSASLANSGSGSEDGARAGAGKEDGAKKDRISPSAAKKESSDDSSSGSTETKNIRKANENLEWNVRWHNKKLQSMSKSAKEKPGHKDDVLGDSVTPNNALARLSSLQHYPDTAKPSKKKRKQFDSIGDRSSSEDSLTGIDEEKKKSANNENASDDSGYRESNDSREETSSSASESSNSNGRNKPLAPTCNVCLIRDDLTTLWCEVTSSIRTRSVEDETSDDSLLPDVNEPSTKPLKGVAAGKSAASKMSKSSTVSSDDAPIEQPKVPETKELLLCLRPIRDGDGKVDESLRFIPRNRSEASNSPVPSTRLLTSEVEAARAISAASNGDLSDGNADATTAEESGHDRKRPPKKRQLSLQSSPSPAESGTSPKRIRAKEGPPSSNDTEKSVVESLMLMSHKSN